MDSFRSFQLAVVIVASIAWSGARAEPAALSLDETIDRALADGPQVAAAVAMADGTRAVLPSAGRLPDPELIAGVENLPIDSEEQFSLTDDFMTMRKIGVMQSFPNHTKRRLREERAEGDIAVADGELRKVRFETAQAASEAWLAAAVAEESLARLRTLKPETDLQAAAARAGLASGRTSAADALTAQSILATLDERILALQQEAEMKRAELTRWIGADASRPFAGIPSDRELGPSMETLAAGVGEHAPLAPLVAKLAAAQTDVELARAEKRPDWSAELTYEKRGPDFSDMISLEFRIGLPLFAKHRQDPQISEKLATVRAIEAERDAEIRMHAAEVQSALAVWQRGRERLKRQASELIPLAHDRTQAAVASYASGRGDLRSAIDALTAEIDTQLNYVQLQGSVAKAWTFLHLLHDSGVSK
jgi:outer membrane protein TolC